MSSTLWHSRALISPFPKTSGGCVFVQPSREVGRFSQPRHNHHTVESTGAVCSRACFARIGGETVRAIPSCHSMLHRMDSTRGYYVCSASNLYCSQRSFQLKHPLCLYRPDANNNPPPMSSKLLFTQSSPLSTTVITETTGLPLYEIETESSTIQKTTVVRRLDLSMPNFFFIPRT